MVTITIILAAIIEKNIEQKELQYRQIIETKELL
jgi:hypothetical protein